MKESICNAFVFGFVLLFSFLIMFILTAAVNYSRANKVKNKILNYIANYAELKSTVDESGNLVPINLEGSDLEFQINNELSQIGYRVNNGGCGQNKCNSIRNKTKAQVLNPNSDYHYCVYAYESERGYYYGVATFMYFDIPLIGTTLEIPVYGETKVIYNLGTV